MRQRIAIRAIFACALAAMAISAARAGSECEANASPSLEYFTVAEGSEDGAQKLTTVTIACKQGDFEASFRAGYISLHVDSDSALQDGALDGVTDSVFSLAYDFQRQQGARRSLRLSADINLPTGLTELSPGEQAALVDSDLVDMPRYGEGWNVGVGANAAFAVSPRLSVALGAGYVYRGPYRPFLAEPRLEPGDALSGTIQGVRAGKRALTKLSLSVFGQTVTERGTAKFYRPGTFGSVELLQQLQAGSRTTLFGSASYGHSWKGAIYAPVASAIPIKAGDTLSVALGAERTVSSRAQIGVRASYVRRGTEAIDPVLLDFTPAREIYSFRLSGRLRATRNFDLSANAFVKRIVDEPSTFYSRQRYRVLGMQLSVTRRL